MMPDMRLRGDRRSLGKLVSPAVNVEKEQASEPSKKRPRKSDANKRVSFGQVHVTTSREATPPVQAAYSSSSFAVGPAHDQSVPGQQTTFSLRGLPGAPSMYV